MKPEIRRYLDEHGATYTREALRDRLVAAGHEPPEVDAALAEWHGPGDAHAPRAGRGRFGLWSFALHFGAFLIVALSIALLGSAGPFYAAILGFLAVVMLIGWFISGAIGLRLLPESGLGVALIAPAVSALLIGGTCVAMGIPR